MEPQEVTKFQLSLPSSGRLMGIWLAEERVGNKHKLRQQFEGREEDLSFVVTLL